MKFLVLLLFFWILAQADDINENHHYGYRNVIFQENLYKNEVAIIACLEGIMTHTSGCYEVGSNEDVFNGNLFTYVKVFVLKRELLNSYYLPIGYQNIIANEISDKLMQKAEEVDAPDFLFSGKIQISDDYTVISEKYYYKLERDTDGNYKMVLQKRELEFTDREKVTDYSLITATDKNGTQVK